MGSAAAVVASASSPSAASRCMPVMGPEWYVARDWRSRATGASPRSLSRRATLGYAVATLMAGPPSARSWRFPATLLAILLLIGIALGVAPSDRSDWLLENSLAAAAVLLLVGTWRRFPLSKLSYSLIFVFLVLHEIGAHYTYSEV